MGLNHQYAQSMHITSSHVCIIITGVRTGSPGIFSQKIKLRGSPCGPGSLMAMQGLAMENCSYAEALGQPLRLQPAVHPGP